MARSSTTVDDFIDSQTRIRKLKWDHEGIREANKYSKYAMQLMIKDMDNPEVPLPFQYAARTTVLKYGYGNPTDVEKTKVLQEILDRESAGQLSFRPEHLRQLTDGAIERLLDMLFDEGLLHKYMETKREQMSEVKLLEDNG